MNIEQVLADAEISAAKLSLNDKSRAHLMLEESLVQLLRHGASLAELKDKKGSSIHVIIVNCMGQRCLFAYSRRP